MSLLEKGRQEFSKQTEEKAQRDLKKVNLEKQEKEDNLYRFQTEAFPDIKKLQQEFVDKNIPPEVMDLINMYSEELSKHSKREIKREFFFSYPSFQIKYKHTLSSKPINLEDYEKEKIGQLWKNSEAKEKPTRCTIDYRYQTENENVALSLKITDKQVVQVWIDSKQVNKDWKTIDTSDQVEFATELVKILDQQSYSKLSIRYSSSRDPDDDGNHGIF